MKTEMIIVALGMMMINRNVCVQLVVIFADPNMSKNPNIVQIDSVTFRYRCCGPQSSDVIADRAVMPTPVSFPLS